MQSTVVVLIRRYNTSHTKQYSARVNSKDSITAPTDSKHTTQVTVAILLNGILGAIAAAEEEAIEAAAAGTKSKEMIR